MKIFLSFLQSPTRYPIPAYDFWEYYIKNGIEEAGYEWTECPAADWALGLVAKSAQEQSAWKEQVWTQTLNWLRHNGADIFLSYLYPEQIDVSSINEIKRMGIPCVNFYCDNVRQFRKVPPEFSVFDLNWVPEFKAIDLYKKAGYPFINLPMPMWIEPEKRKVSAETNDQVTFIGSKDIQRVLLFEKIIERNPSINLCIYGKGWQNNYDPPVSAKGDISGKITNQYRFLRQNGITPYFRKLSQRNLNTDFSEVLRSKIHDLPDFARYNQLISESMITVGINRYPSFRHPLLKADTYSRLRDIEAPMLGACYLTEYTEGLEHLYNIDQEIAVYSSAGDFIEKVNQLSADIALRKKLRLNGQKRALTEHCIPRSLSKIIQRLN